MRYLFGYIFLMYLANFLHKFIQYDRFIFLSNLFFGLEEWMTNQWLRQIERKRDTTFSFFMQNLCIFSNKNCQRPFVFIQKKPTACCCINHSMLRQDLNFSWFYLTLFNSSGRFGHTRFHFQHCLLYCKVSIFPTAPFSPQLHFPHSCEEMVFELKEIGLANLIRYSDLCYPQQK